MAESEDGAALLMGQAKWDEEADASRLAADLQRKAERLSWPGARTLIVLLEVYARDASRSRRSKRQHPEGVDEADRRPLDMALLVVAQAPLDADVAVPGRGGAHLGVRHRHLCRDGVPQ